MMQIRLSSGVPGEEIAQTARLMLASATGPPQIGTLAVAAWAAHVTGDEDAERGYASELLSRADAVDDPELRLEVICAASVRGHHGEVCELIEPYLRERPTTSWRPESTLRRWQRRTRKQRPVSGSEPL